jgi:hypothetical protein
VTTVETFARDGGTPLIVRWADAREGMIPVDVETLRIILRQAGYVSMATVEAAEPNVSRETFAFVDPALASLGTRYDVVFVQGTYEELVMEAAPFLTYSGLASDEVPFFTVEHPETNAAIQYPTAQFRLAPSRR